VGFSAVSVRCANFREVGGKDTIISETSSSDGPRPLVSSPRRSRNIARFITAVTRWRRGRRQANGCRTSTQTAHGLYLCSWERVGRQHYHLPYL